MILHYDFGKENQVYKTYRTRSMSRYPFVYLNCKNSNRVLLQRQVSQTQKFTADY